MIFGFDWIRQGFFSGFVTLIKIPVTNVADRISLAVAGEEIINGKLERFRTFFARAGFEINDTDGSGFSPEFQPVNFAA
jgi:hypothetical protein